MHEAYQPVIEDGRGIFPEDFRSRLRGASGDGASGCTPAAHDARQYARRALLRSIEADGVNFRRGMVEVTIRKEAAPQARQTVQKPASPRGSSPAARESLNSKNNHWNQQ